MKAAPPSPTDRPSRMATVGAMEDLETFDLEWIDILSDQDVALERSRLSDGEPWATTPVAGLQYTAYWTEDEISGRRIIPAAGSRLHLVRRPENSSDANAIEVWWLNKHLIGHLPRAVAATLACRLDTGASVRAYCWREGDGSAWSMFVLLIGDGVDDLHARQIEVRRREREAALEKEAETASREIWGSPLRHAQYRDGCLHITTDPERRPPSRAQTTATATWENIQKARQVDRRAAAAFAFGWLEDERPDLPAGTDGAPDEALRGRIFSWWDKVPAWLMTRTHLRKVGLRPTDPPFARISYEARRRLREYDLYVVRDTVPCRGEAPAARARRYEAEMRRQCPSPPPL